MRVAWPFFPAPATGSIRQAVGYIVLSCILFTVLQAELRLLMLQVHPFQAAFYRNIAAFIILLPFLFWYGAAPLKKARVSTHVLRAVVGIGGMLSMFLSFQLLPMAQAVAFSFLSPLFATAGAALFLGEVVRRRRWSAIAAGMLGMLVMLRPWQGSLHPGMLAALISAVFVAGSMLLVKHLVGRDPVRVSLFYMGLFMTPMSLLAALPYWQPLSLEGYGLVALIGATACLSQACMHRGFSMAEASALLPFDFIRLPLAAMLGWWLFGETVDRWTLTGACIILLSSGYASWREMVTKHSS